MIYNNIKRAKFLNRLNRFIANIEIDGKQELCHVKNTGRCKEFGEVLKSLKKKGVNIIALDCKVTKDGLNFKNMVEIKF